MQKHRIHTDIGQDRKINVEIHQDYDLMEILSLKFSQKDIYSSGNCSEYGVVVGRVSANNGFGVPNAKVSIFIPQTDLDVNDPVISALYPYKETGDKDENGYRYNLLPARQQYAGHTPTGTFFDQEDILTREECLQVFESYYKYTVKTNGSGDFMIWGVPIGNQSIHIDLDLSDIGCFSLRPYDFIKKGMGPDEFDRFYKFKASSNLDGLPQIVTFDKGITVYPLWGSTDLCDIGITRTDFDLTDKGITIQPMSLVLISTATDDNSHAIKRNERIRKQSGFKCNLQTTTGKIEYVRYTGGKVSDSLDSTITYPELEYFNVTEVIDENGVAMAVLPMNLNYVYTNEFGEQEITNDKNKGIPTNAIARFRFSLDFNERKVAVANYLVPNIREFNPNADGTNIVPGTSNMGLEYYEGMLASYQFSDVFEDYIRITPPTGMTVSPDGYGPTIKTAKKNLMLGTNNSNIPEDYFYEFIYGKVYAVSSFQGTHYETDRKDTFLGIKQIRPNPDEDCASKTNYIPTNYAFKNRMKFSLILSEVILFIQFLYSTILIKFAEAIGILFYDFSRFFYNIGIRKWRPFRKISQRFQDMAYKTQDRYTKTLPLTIYPDCEECTNDSETMTIDPSIVNDYCRVAELQVAVRPYDYGSRNMIMFIYDILSGVSYLNQSTDLSFLAQTGSTEITENYIFPGEYAKDPEGLCSGSTVLNYSELTDLHNRTVTGATYLNDSTARYIGLVYPYVDSWEGQTGATLFSEFAFYFSTIPTGIPDDDLRNLRFYSSDGCIWLGDSNNYYLSYDQWNELSGMDLDTLLPTMPSALNHTNAIIRIYDRDLMKVQPPTGQTLNLETGCDKYDKTYDESMAAGYIWGTGMTYYPIPYPLNPEGTPGTAIYSDDSGFSEFPVNVDDPPAPYWYLEATIIAGTNTMRMPYKVTYSKIPNATYDRKTKSGLSEFRNGIFTLIPVIKGKSYNLQALLEWYRRKRVGLEFCGGVTNFSFIDNW